MANDRWIAMTTTTLTRRRQESFTSCILFFSIHSHRCLLITLPRDAVASPSPS